MLDSGFHVVDSVFQVRNSELKHINSLSVWECGTLDLIVNGIMES